MIEWSQPPNADQPKTVTKGYLGHFWCFKILHSPSEPHGLQYQLTSRLIGVKKDLGKFVDLEEAKTKASRTLTNWMNIANVQPATYRNDNATKNLAM